MAIDATRGFAFVTLPAAAPAAALVAGAALIVRSDGLQRWGLPLPGSELAPVAGVQRQTVAALVRVHENVALKVDYELWTFSGAPYPLRHVARAGVVVGY